MIEQVKTADGGRCFASLSDKYIKNVVITVEVKLQKEGRKLSGKCTSPMTPGYHLSLYTIPELGRKDMRYYQEVIVMLRWEIEIVRIGTLLKLALLFSHLDLPRKGHIEQAYHIFVFLKRGSMRRILLDPDHPNLSKVRFYTF